MGLLAMIAGCALIAFNKQFTRQMLSERSNYSTYEFGEHQEKLGRLAAVIVGLGFVAWGASTLLGIGRASGWN